MGIGTLAPAALTLARGERGADCPVAIVEDGFGPRQRVTVGTLATIAAQAAERGIRSPAVVVVGDVVRVSPYAPDALALGLSSFDPLAAPASASTRKPGRTVTSSNLQLRVAIIGAGPAGIYAGNILATTVVGGRRSRRDRPLRVAARAVRPDPLRRRARPPAHQGHRQLAPRDARQPGRIRFVGNVEVGRDITLDELPRALRRRHLRDRRDPRRRARRPRHRPARLVRRRRLRRVVRRTPRRAARVAARRTRSRGDRQRQRRARRRPRAREARRWTCCPTEIADNVLRGARGLRRHRRARLRPSRPGARQVHADRAARTRRGARTSTSSCYDEDFDSTPIRPRHAEQPAEGHAPRAEQLARARVDGAPPAACTCTSCTRRSRCSATIASRGCASSGPNPSATARSGHRRVPRDAVQQVYRAVGYYGTPDRGAVRRAARRDPERRGTGASTRRHPTIPASTPPAGSSAARSASSATPSPTRWRRSPTCVADADAGRC